MEELSGKNRVVSTVVVVVFVVVFALGWLLPEDHTTDRLYCAPDSAAIEAYEAAERESGGWA